MTITINGITDQRLLIALRKVAHSFHIDISENAEEVKNVHFSYTANEEEVSVLVSCDEMEVQESIKVETDSFFDLKYLLLSCFYRLLSELTQRKLPYGVLNGIRPTKLVHKALIQGLSDQEVVKHLERKYLVSNEKANLLVNVVNVQRKILPSLKELEKEVSIYIHIPFCLSKCSYCSFASYLKENKLVSEKEYLDALLVEIKTMGQFLKNKQVKITTLYIGGGTPTALSDEHLKILLDGIEEYLLYDHVLEYTLECGRPDTLTTSKLQLIKNYSVTRISINPQTFNDETLKKVNRSHTTSEIKTTYQKAKALGYDDINMDLIIGLPDEHLEDFKHSIDEVISLNPESITVHNLAIKRGSALIHEEYVSKESEIVQAMDYAFQKMNHKGYIPYYLYRQKNSVAQLENIGYSKKENVSLYNILMIEELQTIIGLGCHASSKFLNYDLILNPKDLKTYMNTYQDYLNEKISLLKLNLKLEDV